MKTLTRTRTIGGSLMVTIPKEIVKEESIQEGELVELTVNKIKKSGFGIFRGQLGKFTEEDKLKGQLEE